MVRLIGLASAAGFLALLIAAPAMGRPGQETAAASAERGRALAQARCGGCHAVGATGDSPHPPAPAFRTLKQRYPVEDLSEALGEGIAVGHPDMPEFVLEPRQIDDLIAYLKSL
jgi:cytochrome c